MILGTVAASGQESPQAKDRPKPAVVSSIDSVELTGFDAYAEPVQKLVATALALTKKHLTYRFGSCEPELGGMDCSGTIYRLLQDGGFKDAPRQSDELCLWLKDKSELHLTPDVASSDAPVFSSLRPGDLLFWTGTYATTDRELPVSHVMLYLGRLKADGRAVIFGASEGRRFGGQPRCGVSVFDFELPRPGSKTSFYGYGPIPGLGKEEIRKPSR